MHTRGHPQGLNTGKDNASTYEDENLYDVSDTEQPRHPDDPDDPDDPEEMGPGDDSIPPLNTTIALDHCKNYSQNEYFACQVAYADVRTAGVRIKRYEEPSCSCGEPEPCRHLNWVFGQLQLALGDEVPANPYQRISEMGIENVCEELHWEFRPEDSDSDETAWILKKDYFGPPIRRCTWLVTRRRSRAVRDILATFSPNQVEEEFREDIFNSGNELSSDQIFVHHDPVATMFRLLMFDDELLQRFTALVTREHRDFDYYRKMGQKAMAACEFLDGYAENGHMDDWQPLGRERHPFRHDIPWCNEALTNIVNFINKRSKAQGASQSSKNEAAIILIEILNTVINRNKEVYAHQNWGRPRRHGEPSSNRNLFDHLIVAGDRSTMAANSFVLKALEDLGHVVVPHVISLEQILVKLKQHAWRLTPRLYIERLSSLIATLRGNDEGGNSPPGPPPQPPLVRAQKRPARSTDRSSKRAR
ncbi:hypothetical protein B7494_g1903 [Chlorociboria aeruginascens]|nr:hypothetical protein B7494_g1903 [Chlorociboria aeruginascens]